MDFWQLWRKPARETITFGLGSASAEDLIDLLGNPRESYTGDCQPITNPTLAARIKTESVGPFRATGHETALQSLRDSSQPLRTNSLIFTPSSARPVWSARGL